MYYMFDVFMLNDISEEVVSTVIQMCPLDYVKHLYACAFAEG